MEQLTPKAKNGLDKLNSMLPLKARQDKLDENSRTVHRAFLRTLVEERQHGHTRQLGERVVIPRFMRHLRQRAATGERQHQQSYRPAHTHVANPARSPEDPAPPALSAKLRHILQAVFVDPPRADGDGGLRTSVAWCTTTWRTAMRSDPPRGMRDPWAFEVPLCWWLIVWARAFSVPTATRGWRRRN